MDKKQFDLIKDHFASISEGLKNFVDILSTQRSISDEEFVCLCTYIKSLKYFINEIEFYTRIRPSDDTYYVLSELLRSDTQCFMNKAKRLLKSKNIK